MSKSQTLRALVNERLAVAAEEIFSLFEKTILEYEEELCRCKEENQRTPQLLSTLSPRITLTRLVQVPPSPDTERAPTLRLASPTPQIKEEPEDEIIKHEEEELPVHAPDSNAVCVDTEETSLLQQRQTQHQEETLGEDISSGTEGHTEHFSHKKWGVPLSCSSLQLKTEPDADQYNHMHIREAQNFIQSCLFPEYSSAHEANSSENNGETSGTDNKAEAKKYECNICQKTYTSRQVLKRHVKIHTGQKPYSCPICKKTCVQKYNLKVHMRTHTGEKPFCCSLCGKTFADGSNYKTHMRVAHMGDTPYSCPFCEKAFCFRSDLQSHIRMHTGEKPFSCSICKKAFTNKSYLQKHMAIHTDEKSFSCPVCENVFARKGNLKRHMKIHRGEDPADE